MCEPKTKRDTLIRVKPKLNVTLYCVLTYKLKVIGYNKM